MVPKRVLARGLGRVGCYSLYKDRFHCSCHQEVLECLQKQGSTAKFVTSVCGGSDLAKAGLLQGDQAANHWIAREQPAKLGVEVKTEDQCLVNNFCIQWSKLWQCQPKYRSSFENKDKEVNIITSRIQY